MRRPDAQYAAQAEALAREHQAASETAGRQLDLLLARPDFEGLLGPPLAFHVHHPTRSGTLPPAASEFFPLAANDPATPADESDMAGRVVTRRDPDGDGSTGLIEVRVTVAWRALDRSDQRVDLVTRRAR
ncbi:MAG: hypothetical protein M9894_17215 [Planctomycetes bacterium]|nr:hypothetical protein [Planctomycetota bacterium]